MGEHPDVPLFRRALEARSQGDDAEFLENAFADNIVLRGAANAAGEARNRAEVISAWRLPEKRAARVEVGEVYSDGKHGIGVLQISGPGAGTAIRQANIFHLENGKITEVWGLPTDRAVVDALAKGESVPEHPNVVPFLAAQRARQRSDFGPEDVAILGRFLSDQVRWYMSGKTTWVDTPGSSLNEVIGRFKMFKQATGGTLQIDIHELFADDKHAACFTTLTADRPGRPDKHMNTKEVSLFHLDQAGRAYEFWGIPADEAERDSFWT